MEKAEAIRVLGQWSADQWGVFTSAQAKQDGVDAVTLLRLTEAGLIEKVGRGVYLVAGAVPPRHLEIKVAWLRLDPAAPAWQRPIGDARSGVISHASACDLHELGDIPSDTVQISVPRRRTTRDPGVVLHRQTISVDDITLVDGLPVTSVERTIEDLLRARADGGHVGRVVSDADQRGLIDISTLASRVQRFVRSYGLSHQASGEELLEALVEQSGARLRSYELERAVGQAAASGLAVGAVLAPQTREAIQQLVSASSVEAVERALGEVLQGNRGAAPVFGIDSITPAVGPQLSANLREIAGIDQILGKAVRDQMRGLAGIGAMKLALPAYDPLASVRKALKSYNQGITASISGIKPSLALNETLRKALRQNQSIARNLSSGVVTAARQSATHQEPDEGGADLTDRHEPSSD